MKKVKFRTLHFALLILTQRGFSLVELLVVLLILGLSSLFVLPSIDRGLKERELRLSALELAAVARELRSRAVYEGSLQRLVLAPAENSYRALQEKRVLSSSIMISEVAGGEPLGEGMWQFLFFPNGSTLGGAIGIAGREGSSYTIRLDSLSGRVEVVRGRRQ